MIVVKERLNLSSSKILAEIVSAQFPEINAILEKATMVEMEKVAHKDDSYDGIEKFLIHKGVGSKVLEQFGVEFSKAYFSMDISKLSYYYFFVSHMQESVKAGLLKQNASGMRTYLDGRITDSQWSYISGLIADTVRDSSYQLHYEDHERSVGYYLTIAGFALKKADFLAEGLGGRGLDTELGDTSMTLLHNQGEQHDDDIVEGDMLDFNEVSLALYEVSNILFSRRNKQGERYVFYDLLSAHQHRIALDAVREVSKEIKLAVKGSTKLAPSFIAESLIGYPSHVTESIRNDLTKLVTTRVGSLAKFDELLTGVNDASTIVDAMKYFWSPNYAAKGIKSDGMFLYYDIPFESKVVTDHMYKILNGYSSLKRLMDYCRKTKVSIMKIPTLAFRQFGISRNFNTLNEYIRLIEITEMLNRGKVHDEIEEPLRLDNNKNDTILSENLLMLKDKLSGTKLNDVYDPDKEGIKYKDLRFIYDFINKTGSYTFTTYQDRSTTQNTIKYYERVVYHLLLADNYMYIVWNAFKQIGLLTMHEYYTYSYKLKDDVDVENFDYTFEHYMIELYRKYNLEAGSEFPWTTENHKAIEKAKSVSSIIKYITLGKTDGDSSTLPNLIVFAQSQMIIQLLDKQLRSFVRSMFDTFTGKWTLLEPSELTKLYLSSKFILDLIKVIPPHKDRRKFMDDNKVSPEYNIYIADNLINAYFDRTIKMFFDINADILAFVSYIYKTHVAPVYEVFGTHSFTIYDVDQAVLTELLSDLYESTITDIPALRNRDYSRISTEFPKDSETGIFLSMDKKYPLRIKDSAGRPTYLHDSGNLIHLNINKLMSSTTISENDTLEIER